MILVIIAIIFVIFLIYILFFNTEKNISKKDDSQ